MSIFRFKLKRNKTEKEIVFPDELDNKDELSNQNLRVPLINERGFLLLPGINKIYHFKEDSHHNSLIKVWEEINEKKYETTEKNPITVESNLINSFTKIGGVVFTNTSKLPINTYNGNPLLLRESTGTLFLPNDVKNLDETIVLTLDKMLPDFKNMQNILIAQVNNSKRENIPFNEFEETIKKRVADSWQEFISSMKK